MLSLLLGGEGSGRDDDDDDDDELVRGRLELVAAAVSSFDLLGAFTLSQLLEEDDASSLLSEP